MTLTQTYHFCVRKIYCLITLICTIILISHIVQLLLIRKFYCFRKGRHIYFKYARHNHLRCPMMGEVSLVVSRSLLKHTCSWRDKLIVLWILSTQAKIFLRINDNFVRWRHTVFFKAKFCKIKFRHHKNNKDKS